MTILNPSTTADEDQYAPEPVSGDRPTMWGDLYTCTGCRDLEECRAAFGDKWSPDGTGCADWTPRRVTLAHLHLREGEG